MYSSMSKFVEIDACQYLKQYFDMLDSEHKNLVDGYDIISSAEKLFPDIKDFLEIFSADIQPLILETFKCRSKISDDCKWGLNCWCVSINIVGLYYDRDVRRVFDDIDLAPMILQYIVEFHQYMEDNVLAKRIVQVALYCLCNYFHEVTSEINLLDNGIRSIIQTVFNFKESPAIKLASGIILAIQQNYEDSDRKEILDYIQEIYSTKLKNGSRQEHLGIQMDLIEHAITCLTNGM